MGCHEPEACADEADPNGAYHVVLLVISVMTALVAAPQSPRGQPLACADLSPKMVELAKERIEAQGLTDRVIAQQADAQDLSKFAVRCTSPSSTFVAACTRWMLMHGDCFNAERRDV